MESSWNRLDRSQVGKLFGFKYYPCVAKSSWPCFNAKWAFSEKRDTEKVASEKPLCDCQDVVFRRAKRRVWLIQRAERETRYRASSFPCYSRRISSGPPGRVGGCARRIYFRQRLGVSFRLLFGPTRSAEFSPVFFLPRFLFWVGLAQQVPIRLVIGSWTGRNMFELRAFN